MSVYVDDMFAEKRIGNGRLAKWSHMFADTSAELEAFARRLGLRPAWLQHAGTHREHYDVTMAVRAEAIRLGAKAITYPAGVLELIEARREVCRCKTLRDCLWAREVSNGA